MNKMAVDNKSNKSERWSKEVIILYRKIVRDKEVYTNKLKPASYTSQELIDAFNKDKAYYVPLTKANKVVKD